MGIKPGFKETDVGVIPEDWKVALIKDHALIKTGKRDTQDRVPDGLYPFFVRSQKIERINSYSFDGEAVLTAGDGVKTGKVFHYIDGKFDFHQRVYKISDFSPDLDGYFFFLMFSTRFYDRIMSMTAKSSVDSVRMEMIADMPIPLASSSDEQREIAQAIRDTDEFIRSLDRLITKKQDLKQAAMQQLLTGKTRLPGFSEEWEEVILGDLLTIKHGKSQHAIAVPDGKYPILATGGVIGRTNHILYDKPSVLIGRKGTIDVPRYMDTPFWTVDTLFYTEIKKCAYPKFIYYLFTQIDWRSYNEASGVPSLNASTIEKIVTSVPKRAEQEVIAKVISDMDTELTALEAKRNKTIALKTRHDAGVTNREDEIDMSKVGQIERKTQDHVVKLFQDKLGYEYLGNWETREGNSNFEEEYLRAYLNKQGYSKKLIDRALFEFGKATANQSKSLYDRNKEVYELLRYGVKVKADKGEQTETVFLIDWKNPDINDFAIAEEVTVYGADAKAHNKRPDIVLYINGIALGVIELKRSTVSVAEGIRQNLDNQKKIFIEHFFSTIQLVMAGNDTEGLRYGCINTPEKYYLAWKEDSDVKSKLDRALLQLCNKERLLELIHDYIVFDAGIKKLCRHNQYFGVKAAQERIEQREGGIIWHTQGSGKSLTMVWLAKWLRENRKDARVLIITDRTELDEQIEGIFKGVNEGIYRTKSGTDLISSLNATSPWLMCSLVHKFGRQEETEQNIDIDTYIEEVTKALPKGFKAKGDTYIFVDECHRTQSGKLNEAMKSILPKAMFIGFTGTPLLKKDKKKSIEIFGRYIHTYKFDEAVRDGVVLDLRYEARDIDQHISSQAKIDQWFEIKTQGLTDLAKAQLKQRWGTMKQVLSSQDRLEKIVADILLDMETRDRLQSGHGNAMLVSGSIYQACKYYELFSKTDLAGKCAIVTSYQPTASDIKGEETGEGLTEKLRQYAIYQQMLADWFNESKDSAINKAEKFEYEVKKKFVHEPGQMKLLIVVDKLLTGFDAPSATYLYIDKQMRDHGLFQAICRVNRLDGEDKEYGYIIDYKDLFKSLEGAVSKYTSGAFDGYAKEDVAGLLENRLEQARQRLEDCREAVKALCEPVEPPKETTDYITFFCGQDSGNADQLKDNEQKRLALYKHVAALIRAYANLANELGEAGYTAKEIQVIKDEVDHFEKVRTEIKLASGDYIDLKVYEPAMRHLIDTYIRAEESEVISAFDDMTLVQLIVERGEDAVKSLPKDIRKNKEAVAETIENNVRKLIIDETPINPKYYDKMSELLDALIAQRKKAAVDYQAYLKKIVELTKKIANPASDKSYPKDISTPARRALYDNLEKNEDLAIAVDKAIKKSRQDDWRNNPVKVKKVKIAIRKALGNGDELVEQVLELAKNQNDY